MIEEADIIRTDLYLADEVFMTGTAAEVTPVRAIDDVEIGVGPVTLELQRAYLDAVNGRSEQWSHWLDVVEVRDEVATKSANGLDELRVPGSGAWLQPGTLLFRRASTAATTRSCLPR